MIDAGRYTLRDDRGRYAGALVVLGTRWSQTVAGPMSSVLVAPDAQLVYVCRFVGGARTYEFGARELERLVSW